MRQEVKIRWVHIGMQLKDSVIRTDEPSVKAVLKRDDAIPQEHRVNHNSVPIGKPIPRKVLAREDPGKAVLSQDGPLVFGDGEKW